MTVQLIGSLLIAYAINPTATRLLIADPNVVGLLGLFLAGAVAHDIVRTVKRGGERG